MMENRKAFNFYRSYYILFNELENDKDKLQFIKAILDLQFTGTHDELTGLAKFAFLSQSHSINAQVSGYLNRLKRQDEQKKAPLPQGVDQGLPQGVDQEVSQGLDQGLGHKRKSKGKSKRKRKSNNTRVEYKYSTEREILNQVCKLFDEKHYNTEAKKTKWLDTIRLLLNNDKFTNIEIVDAVKFARTDHFWKQNFRTITSLRKKNSDGIMKIENILAKMPEKINGHSQREFFKKYPQASFDQMLERYKNEGIVKEKLASGNQYVICNGEVRTVFFDNDGPYLRDINTKDGTITKQRL